MNHPVLTVFKGQGVLTCKVEGLALVEIDPVRSVGNVVEVPARAEKSSVAKFGHRGHLLRPRVLPHLNDRVRFNLLLSSKFVGISRVKRHCHGVRSYFDIVVNDFLPNDIASLGAHLVDHIQQP